MPGEYILNRKAVKKAGVANLNNFNSGAMTLEQMLSNMGMANAMGRRVTAPATARAAAPFFAGDLVINNPKAEPASDSLPRAVRKAAYLTKGR